MLLNEEFVYGTGQLRDRNGRPQRVAYIDLKKSQPTYSIKNEITKYGARYDAQNKWFYWNLGNDEEYAKKVINNTVKPCIENLMKFEIMNSGGMRNVQNTIDELMNDLKQSSMPNIGSKSSKNTILTRLNDFKMELIDITSSEEFIEKMEPIIKFRAANNYSYSLANTILILVQDPKATLVKSGGDWRKFFNRTIKPDAKPIFMWYPKGKRGLSIEEKEEIKRKFLLRKKVNSVSELSAPDRELLNKRLAKTKPESFDLGPYWYDYRFTVQIPGTKDELGSPNNNLPWAPEDGEETPDLISKFDSLIKVIIGNGIDVEYVDDLGGALGASYGGLIKLVKHQKDLRMLNTGIHEFAHELLHQSYAHSKNPELEEYFIGKKEGRSALEQQAELCAWLVLKCFGYNAPTSINYIGIWGLNKDNVVEVFDTVSYVSSYITEKIIKTEKGQTEDMFESKKYLNENGVPNGYEIADMLGYGELYKKSAIKNPKSGNVIRMTQDELTEMIKLSVSRILKENYIL